MSGLGLALFCQNKINVSDVELLGLAEFIWYSTLPGSFLFSSPLSLYVPAYLSFFSLLLDLALLMWFRVRPCWRGNFTGIGNISTLVRNSHCTKARMSEGFKTHFLRNQGGTRFIREVKRSKWNFLSFVFLPVTVSWSIHIYWRNNFY